MAEVDVQARIITLYPVAARGAADPPSAVDLAAETRLFGVTPRDGQSEFVPSAWRPVITEVRDWSPGEYGAPHAGSAYRVTRVRTAVARMPGGIEVVLLDLAVTAPLAGVILAERDAYDPAVELILGSQTLAPAALNGSRLPRARRAGLSGASAVADGAALGETGPGGGASAVTGLAAAFPEPGAARFEPAASRQQILLLPGGAAALFAGGDPADLPAERAGVLRQLLVKDTEIGYRPGQMGVRMPADINGPDRQAVYVWATNTVAEGLDQYGELGRLRVLGLVLSNCQTIAATMACRAIRVAAIDELDEPAPAPDGAAETLRDRAEHRIRRVARLRHELNRNAEMHARGTAVAGGRPVLSYHQAVVAESDLPTLIAVTQHLLEQLGAGLAVEQQLRSVQEARETAAQQLAVARSTQGLLNQSEALKAASVIFASVAAVLGLAGLFAQAAAIPADQRGTYFGSLGGSVVFVLTVATLAVVVGVGVRAASRMTLPPALHRSARITRWLLVVVTLTGIAAGLLLPARSAATPVGVLAAGIGAILLILLVALEFDFDQRRDRTR